MSTSLILRARGFAAPGAIALKAEGLSSKPGSCSAAQCTAFRIPLFLLGMFYYSINFVCLVSKV